MIGATFSQDIYKEFEETKRQNIFEEVIDQMMVDNYLPDEFKDKIKELPLESKRRAIFTFIDENSHFVLNELDKLPEDAKLIDKFRTALEGLKKYIEVGQQEVKKFGEVFTPLYLVEEMLDTLPKEVWSNPELKWLDPASGMGNFPLIVIKRLMVGLKSWESDPNKRYKHIIEKMIYICELQPRNAFMYLYLVDPHDIYDINLYCGSFLDEGFDKHMKEVWDINKFNIGLGNPPYNKAVTASGTSQDFFDEFIFKTIEISKIISFITPSRWFSKSSLSKLKGTLLGKLTMLKHFKNSNEVFPNTDITGGVSYFLYDEEYNSDITNFNGVDININNQNEIFGNILYDQSSHMLYESIIEKIEKINPTKIDNFNSQSYFGIKTNGLQDNGDVICFYSDQKGKSFNLEKKYGRFYNMVNEYKDILHKKESWKVLTSAAYGANPNGLGKIDIISPNEICSESFIFFDFQTEEESSNFKKYLDTNFIKFLISIKKNKQHVTSKVFSLVPKMNFNKEWTDEMLYEYFELNDEEVKLIEESQNLKKNK